MAVTVKFTFFLVYSILTFQIGVIGETLSEVDSLLTTLLSGYNKQIRGNLDQTVATEVNVSLNIFSVDSLDVVKETFEAMVVFKVEWKDERLTWNKSDHNGTSQVTLTQSEIWTPEIALSNPAKRIQRLGNDHILTHVKYTGELMWNIGDVLTARCTANVLYYPFDTQTCGYRLVAAGRWPSEVKLLPGFVSSSRMAVSEEWQLVSSAVSAESSFAISTVTFSFTLKRRPTFFIINQICPILLLGVLNICVFLIPPESGERISYSITVLLSLAVFLSIVGENLPSNSQTMAAICYFLLLALILSSVTCIIVIANLRLYFKDDKLYPVPHWIITLMNKFQRRRRCIKQPRVNDMEDATNSNCPNPEFVTQTETVTWRLVSRRIDSVCMIAFFPCFFIIVMIFLLQLLYAP